MKKHFSTILLGTLLVMLAILSLLIGAMEIDLKILLLSRIPRLLAILCTGIGMSVAGLIMQQLCMNKFVSPSTGATIQSAQFGILLSMVFFPMLGLWGRVLLSFGMAILGTWCFIWFIQRIQFKNAVLVPLVGIMFGNPETTPGGRALKFYASVRLDIRRAEQIKLGTDIIGNKTSIKVVKNKMAPPFKNCVVDIMYGEGVSLEGEIVDLATEAGIIDKSGAWYSYNGEKIGQGKENVKELLKKDLKLKDELYKKVRKHYDIDGNANDKTKKDAK